MNNFRLGITTPVTPLLRVSWSLLFFLSTPRFFVVENSDQLGSLFAFRSRLETFRSDDVPSLGLSAGIPSPIQNEVIKKKRNVFFFFSVCCCVVLAVPAGGGN